MSAIWVATSVRCSRERDVAPTAVSLSASAAPRRVACSAGDRPNRMPVPSAKHSVIATVMRSGSMSVFGSSTVSSLAIHQYTSSPSAPPATASSELSVRSWRMIRDRDAPSDNRIAIS